MKKIKYIAFTKENKRVMGESYIENEENLYKVLLRNELYLSEIVDEFNITDRFDKLKKKYLSSFCRQLGTMVDSGIPIPQALDILSEVISGNKKVKTVCKHLSESVQKGKSLSYAMIDSGAFPEILINVVIAGEENGELSKSLMDMAVYYDNLQKTTSKIFVAMIYPSLLLVGALITILVIFNFIIPKLLSSISSITELPALTKIVLAISNVLTNYGVFIFVGCIFAVAIIALLFRTKPMKYVWSKFKIKIPYMGKLLKTIYTSRFASTFSSLYSSGIPIPKAITLSSNVISNYYIETQLLDSVDKLNAGKNISSTLNQIDGFDRKLTANIEIGEKTGRIEEMLKPLSLTMQEEADRSIDALVALMEPMSIIFLGLLILPIILSVVLPMLSLYNAVGGM